MKIIFKIPGRMGAFWGMECAIFLDESKNKIFCDRISEYEYECDLSQLGHGSTAVCPLNGFVIDFQSKKWRIELLRWWEYFSSSSDYALKQIAHFIEEKFLSKMIKCDICHRSIKGAYNLLHYNHSAVVCDDCFNTEPEKSNAILF